MMRTNKLRLIVILFLGFSLSPLSETSRGDEPTGPRDEQAVRERNRTTLLNDAELKRWSFKSQKDHAKLSTSAAPLMRWSHFTRGRYYGDLYIVTAEKRPVVIFAMFRWFHPVTRTYVCATSLDDSQVVASRNGKVLWQPNTSSLQWKSLPNAGRPSTSQPARLVQMRRLARRFSGKVSDGPVTADRTTFKNLRLLPQPIYRYSTDAADGAIFAFSEGTNPAVLLCLEANLRETDLRDKDLRDKGLAGKTVGWRYGFARRWSFESRMKYEDVECWVAPSIRPKTRSKTPYYLSIITDGNAAE